MTKLGSTAEGLQLAQALFQRPHRSSDGLAAFKQKYAGAPASMISSAAFHVYVDGVEAALEFLARAELFLRSPSDPKAAIDYGVTYELLYHIYNWHQFQALLPDSRGNTLELLNQLKEFVAEDDREAIVKTAEELLELFESTRSSPDFE